MPTPGGVPLFFVHPTGIGSPVVWKHLIHLVPGGQLTCFVGACFPKLSTPDVDRKIDVACLSISMTADPMPSIRTWSNAAHLRCHKMTLRLHTSMHEHTHTFHVYSLYHQRLNSNSIPSTSKMCTNGAESQQHVHNSVVSGKEWAWEGGKGDE